MISHGDVRRIALRLPGSYEQASFGGRPSWRTKAQMFTWIRDDPEELVVWVESVDDKDALMAAEPDTDEAVELITESWRLRAPRSLVKAWDDEHS